MLKKYIHHLLKSHHFWRYAGFDELSELYISMMLRSLALGLVGIFVPIYLYQLGYSLAAIMVFYGCFYIARALADVVAGYVVARIGPKHSLAMSYLLQILALALMSTLARLGWPLWVIAATWGAANSLFFIAYHVDFSKIKHSEHGGKEIGFMTMMERAGAMAGPLVGGVLATLAGPEYTFMAATAFFVIGVVPLLLSGEPVRTRQHISFRGLPYKKLGPDVISHAAFSAEYPVTVLLWPLFISLFIISGAIYAKVGLLASASVLMALLAARLIGRLIDNKKGRLLLRAGATATAAIHLIRPWISSFGGALLANLLTEITSTSIRIPYYKALYDRADGFPGFRIAYLVVMEASGDLTRAIFFCLLAVMATLVPSFMLFVIAFAASSIFASLILTERFAALNP